MKTTEQPRPWECGPFEQGRYGDAFAIQGKYLFELDYEDANAMVDEIKRLQALAMLYAEAVDCLGHHVRGPGCFTQEEINASIHAKKIALELRKKGG